MPADDRSSDLRLTRVYDAPLAAVWDAWTIPEQVGKWWGPRGFTITTHERDLRAGGTWRYTMHGPDGVDYPNVTMYHVVEPHRRMVYDHGATDDTPPLFRVTATFRESEGRTKMELVFSLSSPEAARRIEGHIRKAGGNATWDRLAEHLAETATGLRTFVINRAFDAPIERVFRMWTDPGDLAGWLPPAGTSMRFLRAEIRPGGSAFFVIEGPGGAMHVRTDYLEIEPPRRIVYLQRFVDEEERPAPAPGAETWPETLRTTVLLAEEGRDRTRVTVTSGPQDGATAGEVDAFTGERPGMTLGWTGSFDKLEELLGPEDPA